MTLRQEATGKMQVNLNAKTMCKLDHLKSIADWAATEASIPSLGAFFGQKLAATTEALGIRNDPSLFLCERCESILQPGDNCTVRIETNRSTRRHRRKKSNGTTQNKVIYTCHFCSHRNMMRGTPRGYVKDICPPKPKPRVKSKHATINEQNRVQIATPISGPNRENSVALPTIAGRNLKLSTAATPTPSTVISLLDSKMKKRNRSSAKKVAEGSTAAEGEKSVQPSSKRRRKAWTSLKEIAESSEHDKFKKLSNLTIPFVI